jgi:8-oxo-dGTP pyrophosphatase MutT (NUDIX family)
LTGLVRRTIESREPVDEREAVSKRRMLAALSELPAPFDRHADPVHVTGSAVVVGRRGTVLHLHKRLGRWLQPGGHLEPGEPPWDAARREGEEETGLALEHPGAGPRLVHLDVHDAAAGHTHLDLRYLLLAPDTDPRPPDGESPLAHWYAWEDALAVADEALRGALEVARAEPEAAAATERHTERHTEREEGGA